MPATSTPIPEQGLPQPSEQGALDAAPGGTDRLRRLLARAVSTVASRREAATVAPPTEAETRAAAVASPATEPTAAPGSVGEHRLQDELGTAKRARAFYDNQMLDHLNPAMREFLAGQAMAFVSTADAHGECDCTFRAGEEGFVRVLDERTVAYPEYRGNGVMASLGNISENGHIGMLFVDFFDSGVGLHINGRASIVGNDAMLARADLPEHVREDATTSGGRTPERWVVVGVEEAYIHCSKHIPLLRRLDKDIDWGTNDVKKKGGDYFRAKHSPRPWRTRKPRTEDSCG